VTNTVKLCASIKKITRNASFKGKNECHIQWISFQELFSLTLCQSSYAYFNKKQTGNKSNSV